MIRFNPRDHSYTSVDPTSKVDWLSVTTLVSAFKKPFNAKEKAEKAVLNTRSKWFGMDPVLVQKIWKGELHRSSTDGTGFHNKKESLLSGEQITKAGNIFQVIEPFYINDEKIAPSQKLENNKIYPEHFLYSKTDGICGQTDKLYVFDNYIYIDDYKTNKEIKTEGYKNWEGITDKMLDPISHLEDCNFVHYTLQLGLYLYMALRHNPHLKVGKLTLEHVTFEVSSRDAYGYPLYKRDVNGELIVKDTKKYPLPYLITEVKDILRFYKEYPNVVKSRIRK